MVSNDEVGHYHFFVLEKRLVDSAN